MGTVSKATAATVRSTAFISAFVGLYMATVCAHRNAVGRDHRALYYAAGVVAASALFIEKKSRRAELALYLMPRAVDSLVATMVGWVGGWWLGGACLRTVVYTLYSQVAVYTP